MDHSSSTQAPFLEALQRVHLTALGGLACRLPSGGSKGGGPDPFLILGKKEEITEGRKAIRARKSKTGPPPPPPSSLRTGSATVPS